MPHVGGRPGFVRGGTPVTNGSASRWDLLTIVLAGAVLQYVWRVQEVFPQLRFIQYSALVTLGAVGLFAMDRNPSRRLTLLQHRLFRPFLAIVGMAILSIPTSLHTGASFESVIGLLRMGAVVGVMAASIRDRADVDRLLRIFVLGGAGCVIAAVVFANTGGRLGSGGSYDPNDLGLFTVSAVPLCLYLLKRGASRSDKFLGAGAAAVLLYGTVKSGSRGGFLALVAIALYGLFALDVVRQSKRISVAVVAAAALVATAGGEYWDRMSTILKPQEDYNWSGQAESGRIEVWKRGLGYMADNPLLGVGSGAFEVAEGTLSRQAAERQARGMGFKWSTAHNSYVQIGAELGVFGLAAFIALLVVAFREARRIGRVAATRSDRLLGQAFGALVGGFAVGAVFLSQAYATFLYFALAMLIGLSRIVTRESVQPQPSVTHRRKVLIRA